MSREPNSADTRWSAAPFVPEERELDRLDTAADDADELRALLVDDLRLARRLAGATSAPG